MIQHYTPLVDAKTAFLVAATAFAERAKISFKFVKNANLANDIEANQGLDTIC